MQGSKILSTVAPAVLGAIPGVGPGISTGVMTGLKMAGLGRRRRRHGIRRSHRSRRRRSSKHHGDMAMHGSGMPIGMSSTTYPYSTSFAMPRF